MAGTTGRKRGQDGRQQRPSKKQKRAAERYHSSSENEDDGQDFSAVNLMDSDDDIHNATVDDVAASEGGDSSSDDEPAPRKALKKTTQKKKKEAKPKKDASEEEEDEEEENGDDNSDFDQEGSGSEDGFRKSKSKRNDPNAFSTSLSKILSTKLATSKRADPVLARSAAAHEASKAAVDNALEAKAKKQIRDEKRRALEKGRVKDVLIATANDTTGELETSTGEILETERRLRKVAQRGVVKLFNAVRAAQVKAAETERDSRKTGVIGMSQREEKVNQMSKKGFLELIASGGGGLKKGGLEEA